MSIANRVLDKLNTLADQHAPDLLDPARITQIHPDSLLFYYGNIHSQRGQDGILSEIFRRLHIHRGAFVEFGAWDGIYLSNCRYLFERGWDGVFIEAEKARYNTLVRNYGGEARVRTINAMVGARDLPGERLSTLLNGAKAEFVSIDVDGPDLEIFRDLGFTPPVVLLEGGFNFAPALGEAIPTDVARRNVQQPIAVICATAKELGYVPVCFYQDTYLVRADLSAPFRAPNALTLYAEAYNFMPVKYRESLIAMRGNSSVIRQYEGAYFGHFSADPLAYR